MDIPRVTFAAGEQAVTDALAEAGCVVVEGVLASDEIARVRSELDPFLDAAPLEEKDDPEAFYPGNTRRVIGLIAKSPGARQLALAEPVRSACEYVLLPNCERYQLHVASSLMVGPGARSQILHREDDVYPFFRLPRPNLVVASMWALDPFTADNGGTRLVPGSHLWEASRSHYPAKVCAAEMDPGSVLIWLGGTLHGAGANTTPDSWRCGVFLSYSLGWLRQEENQFLDVPAEVAEGLDPALRHLLGYRMHGGLGFWEKADRAQ